MTPSLFRSLFAVTAVALVLTTSVEASAPAGRYTITSATVFDTKTKLTWQRIAPSDTYSWTDATAYCQATAGTSLGGQGWRLPTIKELQTIVDDSQQGPSIDAMAFPATSAGSFWSSSPQVGSPGIFWAVIFFYGYADGDGQTSLNNVRCVR